MAKATAKRRRQGRPADKGVGREAVIGAARRLLAELPPAAVSLSLIAREANVDPALIRYYFGDRANLLLAVVQDMLAEAPADHAGAASGPVSLRERIGSSHRFTRSARNMQRLMIDELAEAESEEVRAAHRELNVGAIEAYRGLLHGGGEELREVDPLFLYLTIIGIFDFYVSAQPVVRAVTPEGTDYEKMGEAFEEFVADLLLNGLRKR